MTCSWEPGTSYNYGDEVIYEGHKYKIIQPHLSQGDWTPPVTPALWGRMSDDTCSPPQSHQQQPVSQSSGDQYSQNQGYQSQSQSHEKPEGHKDEKNHWFDLDDKSKKALELGGGLAAGAALLGAGFAMYKHHEHHKDEKEWLRDAEARAAQLHGNHSTSGPAYWVLTRGKSIPPNAIVVGKEHSWTLYISRAFYKGGLTIGKASDAFEKGAVIGYGHDEIPLDTYEILVGDMKGLQWVAASGKLSVAGLNARPVEGGHESDGTPLYIARAAHKGAVHPGKVSEKLKAAFIPYGGTEVEVSNYEVLCYY